MTDRTDRPRSPRIVSRSWGQVEVELPDRAQPATFKDAKLYPGGAREWDWNETGTRHTPGVQPADLAELLEHGATEVVLSTGVHERLQVTPEALALLEARDVPAYVLQTERAVARYNELRADRHPGALIHSTC